MPMLNNDKRRVVFLSLPIDKVDVEWNPKGFLDLYSMAFYLGCLHSKRSQAFFSLVGPIAMQRGAVVQVNGLAQGSQTTHQIRRMPGPY